MIDYKKHISKNIEPESSPAISKKERLNKYISNSGICTRRDADKLISSGKITVNDKVVTEMGYIINKRDIVKFEGNIVRNEKKIYLLLNKPKNFATTVNDKISRRNVVDLIKHACTEKIYPVGRLDRESTGLLLFTNDEDLIAKLRDPEHRVKKTYHVWLNKDISEEDILKIKNGLELKDGFFKVDDISYVEEENDTKQVGVTTHSSKNRIEKRIFEFLGYRVEKLDRVVYAGLTKKNLLRSKWRFLTKNELQFIKMI